MTVPRGVAVGRRLQFHHFGLERHHLEQLIDAGALGGGNRTDDRVAAPVFRREFLLLQLLLDPVDVRARQIDLVDRDHDLQHAARPWRG